MNENYNNKNNKIAFSGIMVGITLLLAMLVRIFPFNKMFLLFAMSLIICIVTQKAGILWGLGAFASSSFLIFIFSGRYEIFVGYVLLFGSFPIVKFLIESNTKNQKLEKIIKTVFFALISFAAVYIVEKSFGGASFWGAWYSKSNMMPFVAGIVLIVMEWIYDIILTYAIFFYNKRFNGRF